MLAESVTPATQAITFAVVGGFFTVLTLLLTNRSKHASERLLQDQHERDMIAAAAALAAEDARQIAKEQRDYDRLDEVARRADLASAATLTKLREVEAVSQETFGITKITHALVNSDKTAEMRDRRDSKIATLILMRELVSLKQDAGKVMSAETEATIEALVTSIKTLEENIASRLAQQHLAEAEVEASKSGAYNVQSAAAIAIGDMEDRIASLETPADPPTTP